MSFVYIGNIVNTTIGLASALFHLWFYLRRGRNSESLWAMLISLSASAYAIIMFNLYQGVSEQAFRPYFSFLYLFIALFFWSVLGYATARSHFVWPRKWRWAAGFAASTWIALIFFTPWILGGEIIHIPLANTTSPFAQIKPGIGMGLFYFFHASLAFAALWLLDKYHTKTQTRPLFFKIAFGFFAVTFLHDLLTIHNILDNCCCFFSEYSISLMALVLFINSQEDSASLVDSTHNALLSSQQDFSTLLHSSRDLIAVHDADGFITYINEPGIKSLGYNTSDELIGRSVLDIVHPDDQESVLQRISQITANKSAVPALRQRLRHKDGHSISTEIFGTSLVFDKQPSVLVIARDLSAQVEFETRMMQMDRMVAIGTLAAGVAHEINNPLTFVVGNLELIEDDLKQLESLRTSSADEKQAAIFSELAQLVSEASDGSERIRRTVQDLSALAHDHQASDPEVVKLADVVKAAIRLSSTQTKHRAKLNTEIATGLYFRGHASKITQVVINLLVNAAQSIPLGHVSENHIDLRAFTKEQMLCLQIQDTGTGIAPEVLNTIFDPFVTTKQVGEGTGLGLAISRQIVTDHGGHIEVESQPDEGSCFSIFLPLAQAPGSAQKEQKTASFEKDPEKSSADKLKVLIIDDEDSVRQTLSRMLKNHAQVDSAASVAEALTMLKHNANYDLLICDLIMPQQTGMDMYQHLLDKWPQLIARLVFISGGTFSDEARDFIEKTKSPMLAKPFKKKSLLALLPEQIKNSLT